MYFDHVHLWLFPWTPPAFSSHCEQLSTAANVQKRRGKAEKKKQAIQFKPDASCGGGGGGKPFLTRASRHKSTLFPQELWLEMFEWAGHQSQPAAYYACMHRHGNSSDILFLPRTETVTCLSTLIETEVIFSYLFSPTELIPLATRV